MVMQIIIEPEYRNSFWCSETLKGLSTQASLKKSHLSEIKEASLAKLTRKRQNEVITVIGTSVNWICRIAAQIQEKGYLCLLVTGDQDTRTISRTNSILLDYRDSMHALLTYLRQTGERRIALFGVNPSSYADSVKEQYFPQKKDIYYNFGSIVTCTHQLFSQLDSYTAVICTNDIVAVYLLHYLKEKGVDVPRQLRLISFGDSFLSMLMQPSISSVEQDFRVLGAQAVNVCAFLEKNPQLVVNAFIKCPLRIRESTPSGQNIMTGASEYTDTANVNFYIDESISSLQSLDQLLVESDELDIQILRHLIAKDTHEKIAEALNLAPSSLRYRIRKLRACFPEPFRKTMLNILQEYLPPEALDRAEAIKRSQNE